MDYFRHLTRQTKHKAFSLKSLKGTISRCTQMPSATSQARLRLDDHRQQEVQKLVHVRCSPPHVVTSLMWRQESRHSIQPLMVCLKWVNLTINSSDALCKFTRSEPWWRSPLAPNLKLGKKSTFKKTVMASWCIIMTFLNTRKMSMVG